MPDTEGYNNALRESNTILHFRQGLRPGLSVEVIRRDAAATVKEELKKVQQTEQMLRTIAERKKRHERNATSTDVICNVESKLEQIAETLSRHEEQIAVVNAIGTQPPSRDAAPPSSTQRPTNNVYRDDCGRSLDRRNTYERREAGQLRHFGNNENTRYNYRNDDNRHYGRNYANNGYNGRNDSQYYNDNYNRNYGYNNYGRRDGGRYDSRGYNDQRNYDRGNSRGRGFRGNNRGRRYDNRNWQQRERRDYSRPREDYRNNDRRSNLPLLSIVTILATLLSVAGANQYQICSTTKGQFYVTPPKPSPCDLPPLINPKAARVRVYTPRAAPVTFKAFKCHNITETGCSDYFFGVKTNEFSEPPKFNAIDPDECWDMIANATEGRGPNITTIGPQLWATNDEIIIPRGFIGRQCRSIQKYVIQEGSVGSTGGHHVESLLLSPNHCAIRTRDEQQVRMTDLRNAWKHVQLLIEDKGELRDAYRDERMRARIHQLQEGDLVLKRKPEDAIKHKFDLRFDGPYRVKSVNPPNVVIQRLHEQSKPFSVHVDQVKKFKATVSLPIYTGETTANAVRTLEGLEAESPQRAQTNGRWKEIPGVALVYTADGAHGRPQVLGLDLDETIVRTKSGGIFAENADDWQWYSATVPSAIRAFHSAGFKICIFTNQKGIQLGIVEPEDFKRKAESICDALNVPIQVFAAVGDTRYRKPNVGLWLLMEKEENDGIPVSRKSCIFVGDAAGRTATANNPADYTDSDKLFASNLGVTFATPEQLFGCHFDTNSIMAAWPRALAAISPQTALSHAQAMDSHNQAMDGQQSVLTQNSKDYRSLAR
ncbi:Polynucleotide kinase 3 phosphatase [Aphelenchoides avenae]|nr:Polynucleotide kinase 3 phosphatase [Aphelenchus avenae]